MTPVEMLLVRFERHVVAVSSRSAEAMADGRDLFRRLLVDVPLDRLGDLRLARSVEIVPEHGQFRVRHDRGETGLLAPDALRRELKLQVVGAIMDARPDLLWMHASVAARGDHAVLVMGPWGAGKSTLATALAARGWTLYSDDITPLRLPDVCARPFPLDPSIRTWAGAGRLGRDAVHDLARTVIDAEFAVDRESPPIRFVCFPEYHPPVAALRVAASQSLVAMLAGVLNLGAHEGQALPIVAGWRSKATVFGLRYGDAAEAARTIEAVISGEQPLGDDRFDIAIQAMAPPAPPAPVTNPTSTPWDGVTRTLTVGMATYDDFDGVYFTVQALRLYHADAFDDVELLIVDNHPENLAVSSALAQLVRLVPGARYVPFGDTRSTAARDLVFREATSPYVLCLDSHVFLAPGALGRLLAYFRAHPDCRDLLQGPLCSEDLTTQWTHMAPAWRAGMFGTWQTDDRAANPDGEPFDIPLQGLGLFACRKDAWLGFNPRFRGFGGEEGYIHEKYRRAGRRTVCLPFLRWMHRFMRPAGTSYRVAWEDRIRNYAIGWQEVGLDIEAMERHFLEHVGERVRPVIERVRQEIAGPLHLFDAIVCVTTDGRPPRWPAARSLFEQRSLAHRVLPLPEATARVPDVARALTHRHVVEAARRRGYESLLVLHDDAVDLGGTVSEIESLARAAASQEWSLLSAGQHPDAVAYHARVFDRMLRDIPADESGLAAWQTRQGSFARYVASVCSSGSAGTGA